jgi:hypothetical protein
MIIAIFTTIYIFTRNCMAEAGGEPVERGQKAKIGITKVTEGRRRERQASTLRTDKAIALAMGLLVQGGHWHNTQILT